LQRLETQFAVEAQTVLPVITPTLSQEVRAQLLDEVKPLDAVSIARVRARVQRFAVGALPFESALGALQQWSQQQSEDALFDGGAAAATFSDVKDVVFGRLSVHAFAQSYNLAGREAAIRRMREIFAASMATASLADRS
jgi:hypothetical protein